MKCFFLFVALFAGFMSLAQNKSYYVDNVYGKDANSGTIDKPWKTVAKPNNFRFQKGDKLLFRGSQTFGRLELQKSDSGITIKSFKGVATLGGIHAYNVGNVTIDSLNIVGPGATGNNVDGIDFYMDGSSGGTLRNITIQNVSVSKFGSNGILIGAWATSYGYNNVRILNSNIFDNGIDGFASYGYNDHMNNSKLYIYKVKAFRNYGRTDITENRTGSGFVIGGFDGGFIEYCESYENGKNNRHSGGPQGMWCYNVRNIIFQYCISHDNRAGLDHDGGGFDLDGGSQNCIIQYCYSYNNDGPGYGLFEYGSSNQFTGNIVRYNISQNDARRNTQGGIMLWAKDTFNRVKNSQIYNNTVYVSPSSTAPSGFPAGIYYKSTNFQNLSVFNNIIYTTGSVKTLIGLASTTTTTFSNNDYYNPDATVNFKKGGITVNPLFKSAGNGKEGYQLRGNSPMINAGKATSVTKDIAGTPVPSKGGYDIGAYEANYTAPVTSAGSDKTITLPTNSTTLTATASDADGTIASYNWAKVAGPTQYTINTPTTAKTTVSNLIEGTYKFRVTVMDNDGATAYDEVQVVVNGALPPAGTKYVKVNLYGGSNPYNNTQWNNWNVSASKTASLKYTDNTTSAIKVMISASSGINDNGATYSGTMAPPEVLRYASYSSSARTLTFSGLSTSKTYNLELYASRNNTGNSTTFTIGSTSVTILTDNNYTKKAIFKSLKSSTSGTLVVSIKNVNTTNYLNGFFLSEVSGTTTSVKTNVETQKYIVTETVRVQAFPNPTSDYFKLQINSSTENRIQIRVTDVLGRVVYEQQQIASNAILEIGRSYAPGVYFAEVISDGRKQVIKLVKGMPE